ncbi:MAG: RNA methyltransferase [Brevinematales bacterium]|nr:RNA methyltransferase [Brevinematales bacterium]
MISRNKFVKLNIKQKIYKIASVLRVMEKKLKASPEPEIPAIAGKHLPELSMYLGCIAQESSHPKISHALGIIESRLGAADSFFAANTTANSLIMPLNLCFHDLIGLIDEEIGEKFFDVRRFDSPYGVLRFPVAAILDNIRSPFNVGSIFRSADAFGVSELALCGITPSPPSVKIERTAMGTLDTVLWKYFETTAGAIAEYRSRGYEILAMETAAGAIPISDIESFENKCIVFGNEEFGITDEILGMCDRIAMIPLVGMKNSINVANSFSAVMYESLKYYLERDVNPEDR